MRFSNPPLVTGFLTRQCVTSLLVKGDLRMGPSSSVSLIQWEMTD